MNKRWVVLIACLQGLTGCAGINFSEVAGKGVRYYQPKPYLMVTIDKDCKVETKLMVLPDTVKEYYVGFDRGIFGSSEMSVDFSNGMITKVGQNSSGVSTDVVGGLASISALAAPAAVPTPNCPSVKLYPLEGGKVVTHPEKVLDLKIEARK